ncbi:MAG: ABC transporter substrate-binding protein [Caldilineaceae bacterium]
MHKKTVHAISLLAIFVVLLAGCSQPIPMMPSAPAADSGSDEAAADSGDVMAGAAQPGGVWTRASIADASILNPILSSDAASSAVESMIFPGLIGQDPFTGALVPDGSLSESWETSEDGLTWTFHLRDDVVWSDGDPVDAADFKFTYDAIASDLVESPRKNLADTLESIETPDPYTVVVTFKEVKCDGLGDLGIGLLPSHLYADDFSDIMENDFNEAPAVSAGPLVFQSWARDDNIIATRNDSFYLGAPYMDGMIYKVIPDTGAQLAALQSGEIDVMALDPTQIATVESNDSLNRYRFFDDGYSYIGLNLANPANPQPGLDEDGNVVEQDPHPILSDVNVRKAIAHSLDYDAIINQVFGGEGYQIAANVLPAISWAYDDSIAPYEYDTELAAQLLEDAGWVDSDGDGVREKDGNTLTLSLLTNAGNRVREDLGVLVQDQLGSIGFEINFEAIDFGTLVGKLLGQEFDMVIIGWTNTGADPNDDNLWQTQYDTPGSGFNFTSYHNQEVDDLLDAGVNVPGCAEEERAPIYKQIQQLIHDDVPYVFVSGSVGNTGYTDKWQGLDPGEWSFYWNVEQWSLAQ